eukprot:5377630-Amphidinium_carterae.3
MASSTMCRSAKVRSMQHLPGDHAMEYVDQIYSVMNDEAALCLHLKSLQLQRERERATQPHSGAGVRYVPEQKQKLDCTFLRHQGEPGQGTRRLTILTMIDGEPATKRFAEALITSLNGEVKSRISPSYSHQSLGACEGWHSTLFNHLRLLRLQLSEQYGIPISQDGQSPYSRNWGKKYKSANIAFGETVLCQHNVHENQKLPQRLEPQWSYGVWIGRDTSEGSHITLTSEGRMKSRSVRRLTIYTSQYQQGSVEECSRHFHGPL